MAEMFYLLLGAVVGHGIRSLMQARLDSTNSVHLRALVTSEKRAHRVKERFAMHASFYKAAWQTETERRKAAERLFERGRLSDTPGASVTEAPESPEQRVERQIRETAVRNLSGYLEEEGIGHERAEKHALELVSEFESRGIGV